jgi:hypothetical protein
MKVLTNLLAALALLAPFSAVALAQDHPPDHPPIHHHHHVPPPRHHHHHHHHVPPGDHPM